MSDEYNDGIVSLDDRGLHLRGYYFPWGTKDVAYADVTGLRRFTMSALRGKGRVWGTGNFKYWANLDLGRPKKSVGFIVEVNKSVKPFVTPSDPDTFERVVRERAGLGPDTSPPGASPFI